jgi:hypothetical protein
MLVPLSLARAQIRSDINDDDLLLTQYIKGASNAIADYLKDYLWDSSGTIPEDSNGVATDLPEVVKTATLLLIGYFYRQRDEDPNKEFEPGWLPRPVTALLYPLRTPTVGIPTRRHRHWWL